MIVQSLHGGQNRRWGEFALSGRTARVLILSICVWVAAASCSSLHAADAPSSGKTVVKMGMVGRPDIAAYVLAIRRGYFDRQGIAIDRVMATSGQEFPAQLATNQIQVASGVPNAALFNALNRGIDIRIVADEAHICDASDRTVTIVARADLMDSGVIKGPADLKGRHYAPGPVKGQYPDLLFHKLFLRGGLTEADANQVHLAFPEMLAALSTKQIDAAFLIEPLVRQADDGNIARALATAGSIDPGAQVSIVQYAPLFARQTELATRFMVAYLEGVRDYYDAIFLGKDRDAAIAILIEETPLKDPRLWKEDMFRHTDLNGRVNVPDLKAQGAFYKAQGTLTGSLPDLDKYIDTSFAAEAVKRIGTR
jgi:NitT/TauT family transport system substrate-binding protein